MNASVRAGVIYKSPWSESRRGLGSSGVKGLSVAGRLCTQVRRMLGNVTRRNTAAL